jgi:hypothetical protein
MSTTRRGRDAVERRERLARASAARAKRDRGVGLLLIRLGVATWVVPFLIMVVLWLRGVNLGSVPATIAVPVFAVSLQLVTRGRRMRVGGGERVLAADARAPIVYLRPFGADRAEIAKRMSSRVRISPREPSRRPTRSGWRARCASSGRSSPSATRRSGCRCSAPRACTRPTRTGGRRSTS